MITGRVARRMHREMRKTGLKLPFRAWARRWFVHHRDEELSEHMLRIMRSGA